MSYSVTVLDLTVINQEDDTYRITTSEDVEDLAESIQHVGLINPPTTSVRFLQHIHKNSSETRLRRHLNRSQHRYRNSSDVFTFQTKVPDNFQLSS